jgi:hypothetical protein
MKRSPMPKRRTTKRRTTSPRCTVRGCNDIARIRGWCPKHAEQVADRAFSRWVRTRDDRCTAVGVIDHDCAAGLQAAHIVGRRRSATRFDPLNVWSLCPAAHRHVDQHGSEHAKYRWAVAVLGEDGYRDLMERASQPSKRNTAIEEALGWLT